MDSATWVAIIGIAVLVLGGFLKFWGDLAKQGGIVMDLKDRLLALETEGNSTKESRGILLQKVTKHEGDIDALWERQRSAESTQGQIRVEFATLSATLIEGQKNILKAMEDLKAEYIRHASTPHI